jgi:pimeloyl-ACP methyl ester carboxylesterase
VTSRYVVFSHGQEGGTWGRKITVLADTARAEGYEPESVDYRGIDSPQGRLAHLMDFCKDLEGELVLVGSSLGAYVSVAAASHLHARGVFLMAPAIYSEGLPPLRKGVLDCPTMVIHGWQDEVVSYEDSARFARDYGASLHLLHDDHRLHRQVDMIRYLFEYFLISLDMPASGE